MTKENGNGSPRLLLMGKRLSEGPLGSTSPKRFNNLCISSDSAFYIHAFIIKIFTDVHHVPGSVLSIFLLSINVKVEAQRGKVICLRLHSSYTPQPIFEPKRSRFVYMATPDPGQSASWAFHLGGHCSRALPSQPGKCLWRGICLWRTWQNCSPFKGGPITAHHSLHTPVFPMVLSLRSEFLFPLFPQQLVLTFYYPEPWVSPPEKAGTIQRLRLQAPQEERRRFIFLLCRKPYEILASQFLISLICDFFHL